MTAVLIAFLCVCGCTASPPVNDGGIRMEEWCDRVDSMPWTGCWEEVAQLDCDSGQEIEPAQKVEEFRLTSDGRYSVTWTAFETWVDYAGSYAFSETAGTIQLSISSNAPPDFDGEGKISITKEGELILEDMWLGARSAENATAACGHVFR